MEIISIVVSLYNEEEGIDAFWQDLRKFTEHQKKHQFQIIWVNDGSSDTTQARINSIVSSASTPEHVQHKSIEFSKNFGHEAAMIAGIDHARGNAVVCIDSDRQHPVELIGDMLEHFEQGYEIVVAVRNGRCDHSRFGKLMSRWFYSVLNRLTDLSIARNSSDFFLIDKTVAQIFRKEFRDQNRLIRGFIQSIGFDLTYVEYSAAAREHGESKYSLRKLFSLSFNSIFAFSNKPLRFSLLISFVFIAFSCVLILYSLFQYFLGNQPPDGYTTLIIFLSLSFSLVSFSFSIFMLYFEKTLAEIRKHPLYIIKNKTTIHEEGKAEQL